MKYERTTKEYLGLNNWYDYILLPIRLILYGSLLGLVFIFGLFMKIIDFILGNENGK